MFLLHQQHTWRQGARSLNVKVKATEIICSHCQLCDKCLLGHTGDNGAITFKEVRSVAFHCDSVWAECMHLWKCNRRGDVEGYRVDLSLKGHSVIPRWYNTKNKTVCSAREAHIYHITVPWGTHQSPSVFSLSAGGPRSVWPRTPQSSRSASPPSCWWRPPGAWRFSPRSLHPAL